MSQLAALGGDTFARFWVWWSALPLGPRLGLAGAAGLVVLVGFYLITRRFARRARKGRQRLLVVVSCVSVMLTLLFGAWAYTLPEPHAPR